MAWRRRARQGILAPTHLQGTFAEMTPQEVKARIEEGLRTSHVEVLEFSGGTDHYSVIIVSDDFEGVPLLRRHRMVMELFRAEVKTEEVHALTIKAYTSAQWHSEKSKPRLY